MSADSVLSLGTQGLTNRGLRFSAAPSYDRFTRWASWGRDQAWKRELVRTVGATLQPNDLVVDMATGTGDLAFALERYVPDGQVLGLDISPEMIALANAARTAHPGSRVKFRLGDLMATRLESSSAAAVTASYGLRNCPDFRVSLCELYRILKPGGYLGTLDFVRFRNREVENVFERGMLMVCNYYGWLWHRQPAAYGHLARSIKYFVTRYEFRKALEAAGFEVVWQRRKLFGAIALHLAQKIR